MQSHSDNGGSRIEREQLGEVADAVREMAGQVRTIKVLLIAYVAVSVAISAGTAMFTLSGAFMERIREQVGDARPRSEAGDESSSPSKGDVLPAISLPDADGRVWNNSDWEGKALLLNFWATWCPPCIKEMPLFDEALEKYGENGFAVIAISVDRKGWDVVRPFLEEHKLSYPVLLADESVTRALGKVNRLPTTFFVHKSGTIHSKRIGSMSRARIMKEVEFLLRKDGLLETPQGTS